MDQAPKNLETLLAYRILLDSLSDGVYITDRNRTILYWNTGAERITGYTASEVVGSHCWDNILVHVDCDGHSLCHGACPLIKAMQAGERIDTEAFLTHKTGYRLPVLIRTIPLHDGQGFPAGAVEIFTDTSEANAMQQRLRELGKQSLVDILTGLSNRRGLEISLKARFEQQKRFGWRFGLSFMDIDGFKAINDTHGHAGGDEALRLVAHNLISNSRSFDLPGRWGGDEMMVISENVDAAALYTIAERFRILIATSVFHTSAGPAHITVSIGATMAQQGDTPESLIRRADELMYMSKQSGKNRVTFG